MRCSDDCNACSKGSHSLSCEAKIILLAECFNVDSFTLHKSAFLIHYDCIWSLACCAVKVFREFRMKNRRKCAQTVTALLIALQNEHVAGSACWKSLTLFCWNKLLRFKYLPGSFSTLATWRKFLHDSTANNDFFMEISWAFACEKREGCVTWTRNSFARWYFGSRLACRLRL